MIKSTFPAGSGHHQFFDQIYENLKRDRFCGISFDEYDLSINSRKVSWKRSRGRVMNATPTQTKRGNGNYSIISIDSVMRLFPEIARKKHATNARPVLYIFSLNE